MSGSLGGDFLVRGSLVRGSLAAAALVLSTASPVWSSQASEEEDRPPSFQLTVQTSGTGALLQAVSVVDDSVVWISGHEGTYVRTTDGGATWTAAVVPGADTLQFRDVHAVDGNTAYLLSAGPGELSSIYKTRDGGRSWDRQWVNPEPDGFYDCLDFWDPLSGIVYGDAVDGELRILLTRDGGKHWNSVPQSGLPPALEGEGGFAASGTCVVTGAGGVAWIGTGASDTARVLRTRDMGRTWQAMPTPIVAGPAAGITSLAFADTEIGFAFGGDLQLTESHTDNVAISFDGGRRWQLGGRPRMVGSIYGSALVPGTHPPSEVIVGPKGADVSTDGGTTWTRLGSEDYWAVGAASPSAVWLAGRGGRIVKVSLD